MWSIHARGGRGSGANAVFVQIAARLASDIGCGLLRAGDRLPSTRVLAAQLGVSRNTVVAAFDELVAQGWVTSRGAAGTFVAAELPLRPVQQTTQRTVQRTVQRTAERTAERTAQRTAPRTIEREAAVRGLARHPAYALEAADPSLTPVVTSGARVLLSAAVPDPRLFPRVAMARAYRRALRSRASSEALSYDSAYGSLRLRTAIAAMLRATRALPVGPEHVMITRGSQMALDLASRALIRAGDIAAVEELGYQPAWRALEHAGAKLAAVPLDEHGLVVDALPARVRCVYTTPHHQYPTTVLMSPGRRMALLERARRERFAIIEDDYDHEFHFDGRPVAPLASTDEAGSVIYMGSLSKILAPGLRIGFVAAPETVIATLAALRGAVDRQGDLVVENAVAELVEEGEVQRHANKLRRIYASRREAFAGLLRRELGSAITFTLPAGGITVWARVSEDVPLERWRARCLEQGVAFAIAKDFALDRRSRPFMRLAFARYTESELGAAIRVLARALRR